MIIGTKALPFVAACLCGWAATCGIPTTVESGDLSAPTELQPEREPDAPPTPEVRVPLGPLNMDLADIYDLTITGTPVPFVERDAVARIVRRELERYPRDTIVSAEAGRTVVSAVYIYRDLNVNGGPAGGTYVPPGLVYLSAGTAETRGDIWEEFLVRALHHEVSSQLLFRHRTLFDEQAFRDVLPEGFVYEDERPNADSFDIHKDKPGVESLQDLADGFLTDYASRNIEQDFNTYAEILLWRPELLDQFAADSRVARKAAIVRQFYLKVSEDFRPLVEPQ